MACNSPTSQVSVGQVSRLISDARAAQKMTLREFAAELGVSFQVIAYWEAGEREISSDTILPWWNDPREWVHNLARDILVVKFAGIADEFNAPAQAPNGKAQ